ncbi:hypothetical protein VT98_12571 [Candidatus Electrothrix communis]|uniref:Uncharacterized protein n=1 Tax=Candidatus Electrothrix communis TaxID=1859133 RepID=A0A3S3U9J2_9BACT|nr:hypothetical protein VT98_12571 [Candidatus Electrothrix communis]
MIRNLSRPCGPWSCVLLAQNNNSIIYSLPLSSRSEGVNSGLRNNSGTLFVQQMFLLFFLLQADKKADCDQVGNDSKGDCQD